MLVKNVDVQRGLVNGSRGVVVAFQPVAVAPSHQHSDTQAHLATAFERLSLQGDIQQDVERGISMYPIVRFDGVDELQTMAPLDFEFNEDSRGQCSFRRQVPLTLAWALSIHKSQGLSISKLEVDCSGAWADGQVYVALSRGRTLHGLTVRSLGADGCCKADPKVLAFYAACEAGAQRPEDATMWTDSATIAAVRRAAMSKNPASSTSAAAASPAPAPSGKDGIFKPSGRDPEPSPKDGIFKPSGGAVAKSASSAFSAANQSPTSRDLSPERVYNGNPDGPKRKDGSPDMRYALNYDPKHSPSGKK